VIKQPAGADGERRQSSPLVVPDQASGPRAVPAGQGTPLIIGCTGHRNLVAGEVAALRQCVHEFFVQMQREFPALPLLVLSSLAGGCDQLVAQEALAIGARVIAPLPLPLELYARDFSAAGRAALDDLCRRVQVVELPLLPGDTLAAVAVPGAARDRQYAHAGMFVASHSHVLLTLWDGRDSGRLGGTAQVVHYHLDGIMPGLAAHGPTSHAVLDCGDESLLYHIPCSRAGGDGAVQPPLPPLRALQSRWVDDGGAHDATTGMPRAFRRLFEHMQQFNVDAADYASEIAAAAATPDAAAPTSLDRGSIGHLFATADWLAMHFQRQVLRAMRGLFVLAALMAIAFVGYSDLPDSVPYHDRSIYVFVVLFAAGVGLSWLTRHRDWHRKYIDYRALAEGLRVQRYWLRAGVAAARAGIFAHDNFMQKQDIELGWIRNMMRTASVRAFVEAPAPASEIAAVVEAWVGQAGAGGQLDYYARKTAQRSRAHQATQRLGRSLLGVVISISVILALLHQQLSADTSASLVVGMGVLTIIAATRESYAYRMGDKELIKQYRYMWSIFAAARRKLDVASDAADQRDILHALGEAALAEHAEWALMHRARPPEHGNP